MQKLTSDLLEYARLGNQAGSFERIDCTVSLQQGARELADVDSRQERCRHDGFAAHGQEQRHTTMAIV